jgi:SEC-C motif-containing protein
MMPAYNFLFLVLVVSSIIPSTTVLVAGFAAAKKGRSPGKKGNNNSSSASTNRGFGAPPKTFDQVLSEYKTRLPSDASTKPCPCGISSLSYRDCCEPLHLGIVTCQTPLQVLQSRYSAFCYRNIGHIIVTTHRQCRDYREDKFDWAKDLDKSGMFDSFEFVQLQLENAQPEMVGDDEAYLEFQVLLRGRDGVGQSVSSVAGQETIVSGE